MPQILNDNVQVTCIVDGDPWIVEEAEVVRTRVSTPDYTKLTIAPDPAADFELEDESGEDLIGVTFRLEVDNELYSERDTESEEDTLLFVGRISNISPLGDGFYDAVAFDPSQQALSSINTIASEFEEDEDQPSEEAPSEEDSNSIAASVYSSVANFDPNSDEKSEEDQFEEKEPTPEEKATKDREKSGSLLNKTIYIPMPEKDYSLINGNLGTYYEKRTIKASKLVKIILESVGITDFEIGLSDVGTPVNDTVYAKDTELILTSPWIKAVKGLQLARNMTASEWWFDKEGVFYFGKPDSTLHELKYITDASDGKTTPPYKSVKVIGSGIASEDGYSKVSMESEDKVTFKANIKPDTEGKLEKVPDDWPSLREPTYTHRSAEIVTDDQAKEVAKQFISDMSEQQSDGEVTVVGFPEVMPLDGIKMPSGGRQPMGGYEYGVYKVIHRLNSSDGFITKINVSGTSNVTRDMCFIDDVPQPAEEPPESDSDDEDSSDSSGNSSSDNDSEISFPAQNLFQTEKQTNPELDLEKGDYPAQSIYDQ